MFCAYPDCVDQAQPGGTLCYAHAKRQWRGQDMRTPKRERLDPWGRVVTAAIELADADSEDDQDFHRREARLRAAARRWAGASVRHRNR